jgi:hypothetical protein
MKKLMTYELDINEDEAAESGIDYVSLVDDPAIQENWMTFEAQKSFAFKVSSPERRIITGAAMIADMPIFRKDDARGEYNGGVPQTCDRKDCQEMGKAQQVQQR